MLDLLDATTLTEASWQELASRAELPCTWQEYVAAGTAQPIQNDTRKYCRIPLRSIAIVLSGEQAYAAYAKDISKVGIGFYSPVNMLPRDFVRVWLPGHSLLRVRLARCRRLRDRCFECGGLFEAVAQSSR
jgi:hypothetical protein